MDYVISKPFLVKGQPVKAEEVIRITMLDEPSYERVDLDKWEWVEEGLFEWAHLGTKYLVNLEDLRKEIKATVFSNKCDDILDRLLNFRKLFLIIPTLEVVLG